MVVQRVELGESLKKCLAGYTAWTGFGNSLNKICIHLRGWRESIMQALIPKRA